MVAAKTGLLAISYLYPSSSTTYDRLIQAKMAYPSVPINVVLGIAHDTIANTEATYMEIISRMRLAGIPVFGYVSTVYGNRPFQQIKSDIDWLKDRIFGNLLTGIFFDEVGPVFNQSFLYSELVTYAKNIRGFGLTIGNAGVAPADNFKNIFDILIVHENEHPPTKQYLKTMSTIFGGKNKIAFLVHTEDFVPTEITDLIPETGWLYYTDDTPANPWDTIPPYLENLVQLLSLAAQVQEHDDDDEEEILFKIDLNPGVKYTLTITKNE